MVKVLRRKHSEIKRQLLDQTVVSGIGNIYADESLWRAKVNGARMAETLTKPTLAALLDHAADVMTDALGQGGTSFDSLYVNVNGESGYFDRSLDAYGREGEPCRRCGAVMRRDKFMNRSSFYCPRCQPKPRAAATTSALTTRVLARGNRMTELWVERTGVRRYTGRSTRGAEVLVGSEDVEGVFTPGELLKIALAACSGMSSDHPLRTPARRRLRRPPSGCRAPPTASRSATRCSRRRSKLDLSGLSEDEVTRVLVVVRAVDRQGVHRRPHAEVGHRGDVRGQRCRS